MNQVDSVIQQFNNIIIHSKRSIKLWKKGDTLLVNREIDEIMKNLDNLQEKDSLFKLQCQDDITKGKWNNR
jgi:predicted translin family RNA/ssDNA-binding protein